MLGVQNRNPHTAVDIARTEGIAYDAEKYLKYQCPICQKIFAGKVHLEMHKNIHTGAKPFVCDDPNCGARFSHSSNLGRHIKTVHSKQ